MFRCQLLHLEGKGLRSGRIAIQELFNYHLHRQGSGDILIGVGVNKGCLVNPVADDVAAVFCCRSQQEAVRDLGFCDFVMGLVGQTVNGDGLFVAQGDGRAVFKGDGAVLCHLDLCAGAGVEGVA